MEVGSWVLHYGSGVVDQIAKIYSGIDGDVYVNPSNDVIRKPVVLLESGHGFINEPDAFMMLTDPEVGYLLGIRAGIRRFVDVLEAKPEPHVSASRRKFILGSELVRAKRVL